MSLEGQGRLCQGSMNARELEEFVRGVRGQPSEEEIEGDPVLLALWENQLRWMEVESKNVPEHWFAFYRDDPEELRGLRQGWMKKVVPGRFRSPEDIESLPRSLLAAEVLSDGGEVRIADYIHACPEHFEEILPEMSFLGKHRPGEERPPSSYMVRAIWRAAANYAFDDRNKRGRRGAIRENFRTRDINL